MRAHLAYPATGLFTCEGLMLPHAPAAPPAPRRCGVGIDTSRYGHVAVFLRDDGQPAAPRLSFPESAAGYERLRQRLARIAARLGPCHFAIRLDAAGQYADNLLHFLHALAAPDAAGAAPPFTLSLSCGDPQRNKNYRAALFGPHKSDAVEAHAAARYALGERPAHVPPLPGALRVLRHVAGRLQAVVRQRTRLINQFHHLLALTFPELALLTGDLAAGWVLELVHRYPTAERLARAGAADLADVAYLPADQVEPLLEQARASIASLHGPLAEELVREQVRQLRDADARQNRLENLLVSAYRALPRANHLDSIPGIGAVTAAVLTAFIVHIDRFATPGKLVAYFGVLPVEVSSGVDRDGRPRGPRRYVMSRRGNDLVRRYLWMAALSAIRHNPAVQALHARVAARHPGHKAVAVGHAMRKLLHLAFAIWKKGTPFDGRHYARDTSAHVADTDSLLSAEGRPGDGGGQTAGHTPGTKPAQPVVTAACADKVDPESAVGESSYIDFAHVKRQLPCRGCSTNWV
jgi:transposase